MIDWLSLYNQTIIQQENKSMLSISELKKNQSFALTIELKMKSGTVPVGTRFSVEKAGKKPVLQFFSTEHKSTRTFGSEHTPYLLTILEQFDISEQNPALKGWTMKDRTFETNKGVGYSTVFSFEGKKAFTVENDGDGGCDKTYKNDPALAAKLEEILKGYGLACKEYDASYMYITLYLKNEFSLMTFEEYLKVNERVD